MQKLPDSIANHLWPGCKTEVETQPMESPWGPHATVVTKLTLSHPESPITIIYKAEPDETQVDITASGLYQASSRDVRQILPVLTRLRDFMSEPKPHKSALIDYDRAFEQIEGGKDPAKVKADFMASTGGSSDAFNQAMYRRREQKKRRQTELGYIQTNQ